MSYIVKFVTVVIFMYLFAQSVAMPAPDEEHYLDREYNRELMNWLIAFQYPQRVNNLCKLYAGSLLSGPMAKRNSELINSLLSLPKNMNDAGK